MSSLQIAGITVFGMKDFYKTQKVSRESLLYLIIKQHRVDRPALRAKYLALPWSRRK